MFGTAIVCADCASEACVSDVQAEKNLAWEAAQAQNASMLQLNTMATAGSGPCKLYINNLHPNIQVCQCGEGDGCEKALGEVHCL